MARHSSYPLLLLALACTANAADAVRERAPTEAIVYFVLPDRFENGNPANDRGGLKGDRLKHGFDPTSKAFFHGGPAIVIAFNTSPEALATMMEVDAGSRRFTSLHGKCESEAAAPGSYRVALAPLDYVVCAAGDRP